MRWDVHGSDVVKTVGLQRRKFVRLRSDDVGAGNGSSGVDEARDDVLRQRSEGKNVGNRSSNADTRDGTARLKNEYTCVGKGSSDADERYEPARLRNEDSGVSNGSSKENRERFGVTRRRNGGTEVRNRNSDADARDGYA